MVDPALLQVGTDLTHDVVLGPGSFDYPWGDSAADEAFVYAVWDIGRRAIAAWREERVERRVEETLNE